MLLLAGMLQYQEHGYLELDTSCMASSLPAIAVARRMVTTTQVDAFFMLVELAKSLQEMEMVCSFFELELL